MNQASKLKIALLSAFIAAAPLQAANGDFNPDHEGDKPKTSLRADFADNGVGDNDPDAKKTKRVRVPNPDAEVALNNFRQDKYRFFDALGSASQASENSIILVYSGKDKALMAEAYRGLQDAAKAGARVDRMIISHDNPNFKGKGDSFFFVVNGAAPTFKKPTAVNQHIREVIEKLAFYVDDSPLLSQEVALEEATPQQQHEGLAMN